MAVARGILLEEEFLESFHPSLSGLECQLNSLPSSWLNDELSASEASTYVFGKGNELTRSPQVTHDGNTRHVISKTLLLRRHPSQHRRR